MNISKTLIANATANLGSEKQAAALQSAGRAFQQAENSTKKVVKTYADENVHPAFFVSPYDKQGNVNPKSLSKATPQQYDAQTLLFAAGMGNCDKGLSVTTCAELIALDPAKLDDEIATKKEAMKHSSDKKAKAKLSAQIETLQATKKARSVLKRRISPKFRDLAQALISEYKRRAKAEAVKAGKADSNDIANEVAATFKTECGFASVKTTSGDNASTDKAGKDESSVIMQHAKNLLTSLRKADNPPANVNKLVKELEAILVNH